MPWLSSHTSAAARRSSSSAWAAIRERASASDSPRARREAARPGAPRRRRPPGRGGSRRPAASRPAAARRARRPPPAAPGDELGGAGRDQRVGDRLQVAPGPRGRRTPTRPQRGPVQRTVGTEDVRAEVADHGVQTRRARGHDLTGQPVGVDDHRAELAEPRRHRRLARPDPAGETHAQHAADCIAGPARSRPGPSPTRPGPSRDPARPGTPWSARRRGPWGQASASRAGKPPVATGPHRVGVIRSRLLPWARIACAVLVPVGVLAGDRAEVVDQRLEGVGQVEHLAGAVDLHPGAAEVVGQRPGR